MQQLPWSLDHQGARQTAALGAGLQRKFEHVGRSAFLRAHVCICVHASVLALAAVLGTLLTCQQSLRFSAPGHVWQQGDRCALHARAVHAVMDWCCWSPSRGFYAGMLCCRACSTIITLAAAELQSFISPLPRCLFCEMGGGSDFMLLELMMHWPADAGQHHTCLPCHSQQECQAVRFADICTTWPYIGAAMMSADMVGEKQWRRWEHNEQSAVERMEQQEEARQEMMQVWWFCQTATGQAVSLCVFNLTNCKGPYDQWSTSLQQKRLCLLEDSGQVKLGAALDTLCNLTLHQKTYLHYTCTGLQRVGVQQETEAARQRAEQSKLAKAETEAQKRARLKAIFLKKQLQAGKANKQ